MEKRSFLICTTALSMECFGFSFFKRRWHVSFSLWQTTHDDFAEGQIKTTEGYTLYETETFKPPEEGWTYGGMAGEFKKFPDVILVSWRRPSPQETPSQRCDRRMESPCEKNTAEPTNAVQKNGAAFGPVEVNIKERIPSAIWKLYESDAGSVLEFGIGVGGERVLVRWVLKGPNPKESGTFGYIAHGGDWDNILPPSAQRKSLSP